MANIITAILAYFILPLQTAFTSWRLFIGKYSIVWYSLVLYFRSYLYVSGVDVNFFVSGFAGVAAMDCIKG